MSNSPHHYKNLRRKIVRRSKDLTYETPESEYDLKKLREDRHSSELSESKLKKEVDLSHQLKSLEHNMQVRKARGVSKRSKRTTAGLETDFQMEQKSFPPNSKHWRDISKKRTAAGKVKLDHKLAHQKKG